MSADEVALAACESAAAGTEIAAVVAEAAVAAEQPSLRKQPSVFALAHDGEEAACAAVEEEESATDEEQHDTANPANPAKGKGKGGKGRPPADAGRQPKLVNRAVKHCLCCEDVSVNGHLYCGLHKATVNVIDRQKTQKQRGPSLAEGCEEDCSERSQSDVDTAGAPRGSAVSIARRSIIPRQV